MKLPVNTPSSWETCLDVVHNTVVLVGLMKSKYVGQNKFPDALAAISQVELPSAACTLTLNII